MFKKILFALLASAMVLTAAACSTQDDKNDDSTDTTVSDSSGVSDDTSIEEAAGYAGTLEELAEAIYEKSPMEAAMGPAMQIDLSDAYAVQYYLGLSDATGVKEAVFSEPMIGSIPYSLCLIRLEEGTDASAIMQNVLDGVNMRKWVCVETDKMIVANCGDVVLMVMCNVYDYGDLAGDQYAAFAEVVTGEVTKLEK